MALLFTLFLLGLSLSNIAAAAANNGKNEGNRTGLLIYVFFLACLQIQALVQSAVQSVVRVGLRRIRPASASSRAVLIALL